MTQILFYGDPHGEWRPLLAAVAEAPPDAVVILGDSDLEVPLREAVAPVLSRGVSVLWIPGNHDSDRDHWHDNLVEGGVSEGALHGTVRTVGNLRLAGLGGVFREAVWHPHDGEGRPRFQDRHDFLRSLPPDERWRDGLPRRHRTSIFPEDYERLADQRADVLVTHEAPSCHRHGFEELDLLAEAMGARLIVHGHHHEDYEAMLPSGIRVLGVGRATVRQLFWWE